MPHGHNRRPVAPEVHALLEAHAPFIAHIFRATVRTIRDNAEQTERRTNTP